MSVEERWRGRPKLALALKTLIVAVPLAASVIVSLLVARWLPVPEGLLQVVLWWLALMAVSAVVLIIGEAFARRFLPLVALLRLSLLFPGPAPSRIGVARASTRRELRRLSEVVQRDGLGTDLATVARTLVVLVGALDVHDRSTRGHSERVRVYADLLAERIGLEEADRDRLRWAALLHDLGKLRIPVEVLNKRSDLSEADWEMIHRHPEDGEKMLGSLKEWLGPWASVVRHHHERWDGDGYPDELASEDIGLGARIVAIADSYDVMTSIRSYQPRPKSAGAAREEIVACAGTQFDPHLVRTFLGLSTRRLWLILGPLAWIAQVPVIGPVLTEAVAVTAGRTAIVIGTAGATEGGLGDLTRVNERRAAPRPQDGSSDPSTTVASPSTDASGAPTTLLAESTTVPGETTIPESTAPTGTSVAPETILPTTPTTVATTSPPATTPTTLPAPPSSALPSTTDPGQTTTTPDVEIPRGTPLAVRPCADTVDTAPDEGSPPELSGDSADVTAGESVPIDVIANDSDPDGDLDAGSIALGNEPGKGTVTLLDGVLLYVADEDANGTDQFTYTMLDSFGRCGTARVTVTID